MAEESSVNYPVEYFVAGSILVITTKSRPIMYVLKLANVTEVNLPAQSTVRTHPESHSQRLRREEMISYREVRTRRFGCRH